MVEPIAKRKVNAEDRLNLESKPIIPKRAARIAIPKKIHVVGEAREQANELAASLEKESRKKPRDLADF